tara:strand:- start:2216 stop:3496 length:1281 start_codon:yes stop_codon:yes gene_type:complete
MRKLSITIVSLILLLGNIQTVEAQFLKKLKKRAEEAATEAISRKVEEKTTEKTEKAMDTILNVDKKIIINKKDKEYPKTNDEEYNEEYDENNSEAFEVYSNFDFAPGDKVLLYDDFSLDNLGDFPSKWNTNGAGEIVEIDEEKWLMLVGRSVYIPELSEPLPKEYTIEFDMLTNGLDKGTSSQAKLEILLDDNKTFQPTKNMAIVEIPLGQYDDFGFIVENKVDGKRVIRNKIAKDVRSIISNKTHVSIAVNEKRFRMYFNENKIVDVPRLIPEHIVAFKLHSRALRDNIDQVFISNIKIAQGGIDLRSKLLTDGRYSTTGILFNSGSDKIKPESYGVLKEISEALLEDLEINLNIIGHTDSDGDEEDNIALSEQRAQAVKNILVSKFNINEDRLQTEGKGETEPVDNNTTTEGKSNNRRVEFVKF